jgi:replicative DNA helicase
LAESDDEDLYITQEDEDVPDGSEVMDQCLNNFLERHRGEGPPEISTGIKALDRAIIGFRPKKMYVCAARPGMGKTAFKDTVRRSVIDQGYVCCDFNLEMGSDEIGERELAFRSLVSLRKVMAAREVSDEELARLMGSAGAVPRGLWWVWDNCFSMDDIRRRCLAAKVRAKREGKKIGLVVIDYLQLMGDQGTEGRQQSVSACSRMIKILSKEMDCAVLALSQLNRQCDYREDHRPLMADIRESGSIEQDADTIMFIYRDSEYNAEISKEETELIIRKQRAGPTGTVRIRFNPRTVHFDDFPSISKEIPNEPEGVPGRNTGQEA